MIRNVEGPTLVNKKRFPIGLWVFVKKTGPFLRQMKYLFHDFQNLKKKGDYLSLWF